MFNYLLIFLLLITLIIKFSLKPKNYLNDNYNYKIIIKGLFVGKANNNLIFDKSVNASLYVFPPLYEILYYYINKIFKIKFSIFQSFFECLVYISLFYFLQLDIQLENLAIIGIFIYFCSPLFFKETLYFNDRLLALILLSLNVYILSQLIIDNNINLKYFVLCILTYVSLVFSHKHSLQLLYVIYLFISLFYISFLPIILIIFSEFIGNIFSKGYMYKIHKDHFLLLSKFCYKFLFPKNRLLGYGKDQLILFRRQIDNKKENKLKRVVRNIVNNWDYILQICIAGYLIMTYQNNFWINIFFITLSFSLLTQFIYKFKFLGEGNRYLVYNIFFMLMSFKSKLFYSEFLIAFIFLWCIGAILIDLKHLNDINKNTNSNVDFDFEKITSFIKTKEWDRFIVFPIQKTYAFVWKTEKNILHFLGAGGFIAAKDWFPQITKPLDFFIKKYEINYVFLDERYININELKLNKYLEVYRQNNYVIYKVSNFNTI